MLFALAYRFRYAILAVGLLGLLLYALKVVDGRGYDRHKRETEALVAQARQEAMRISDTLVEKANANTKEKEDALKIVTAKYDTVASELRQRPSRRPGANLPQTGTACEGGTGTGLSGPDAGFLTREAARAQRLQIALAQCYKQYGDMEQALTR